MVAVKKTKGQSKDSMLRRFTKRVLDEGYIDILRNRTFYRSPSMIKKEKAKELTHRRFRSYND